MACLASRIWLPRRTRTIMARNARVGCVFAHGAGHAAVFARVDDPSHLARQLALYDHQHSVTNRDHVLFRAVSQIASKLKGRIGAVESEWLPVAALDAIGDGDVRLSNISLGTELRSLRRSKEPDEIALLEECMRATDIGQAWARANIKPGMTELDVYRGVQSASLEAAGRVGLIYGC